MKEVETIIYGDNKAAIKVAMSEESNYPKYEVAKRKVILRWISTKLQISDVFTKALSKDNPEFFREIN